jgi:hypothetical protein
MKVLPGREQQFTPLQNHMEELLWPLFTASFASEPAFHVAFDKLEVLAALSFAIPAIENETHYWTLPGAYGWRHENRARIFKEIRESLWSDKSPLLTSGLVGKSSEQGLKNLSELEKFVPEFRWR